jgi:hypothetical protein
LVEKKFQKWKKTKNSNSSYRIEMGTRKPEEYHIEMFS